MQAPASPRAQDAPGLATAEFDASLPGANGQGFPGYEVLGELGRGGMGVVYKARHLALGRIVALKMIRSADDADEHERARFQAEAKAIARLHHVHIVQVFDCGTWQGEPYLALEYCGGGSLAERLRGAPLPPAEAARLVEQLTDAVAAAHAAGIVHRDLKPANVLLSEDGVAKVTDFGLAKHIDDDPGYTRTGTILGTPSYMAPEQALGEAKRVGPAADVYALGAILYEMLTGRPPFRGASVPETLEQVRTQEPVPPRALQPRAPADLETICLKCLHKQPGRRYGSAVELAEDLRRYRAGLPIRARPLSALGGAARWARRHKSAVIALVGLVLLLGALTAGLLVASALYRGALGQRDQERTRAEKLAQERDGQRDEVVEADKRAWAAGDRAVGLAADLRYGRYVADMNLAGQAARSPGGLGTVAALLRPWAVGGSDLRDWEWYYLHGLCHRERLTLRGHAGEVRAVAWSPDGKQLASAGADWTVRTWDAASGRHLLVLTPSPGALASLAWRPDGKWLASGHHEGTVQLWDVAAARAIKRFKAHSREVTALAWSPDGKRLASTSSAEAIHIWGPDFDSQSLTVGQDGASAPATVAWSPDGKLLASGGASGKAGGIAVQLWDAVTGKPTRNLGSHIAGVTSVAWAPDGKRLATGSQDRSIKVWDVAGGKDRLDLMGHSADVFSLAWGGRNGDALASCGADQAVRIWSTQSGKETAVLRGHQGPVLSVAWRPDGTQLASASADGTVKLWPAEGGPEVLALDEETGEPERGVVTSLAWAADGNRLAAAGHYSGTVAIWDTVTGVPTRYLHGHESGVSAVCWSPDGKRLASCSWDETIRTWDAASGKEVLRLRGIGGKLAVAWGLDGKNLAAVSNAEGAPRAWDAADGKEIIHLTGRHASGALSLAWSPDGTRLATGSYDATVKLWDLAAGRETLTLRGHSSHVRGVAWAPDGRRVASGGEDWSARIWDAASGNALFTLRGHNGAVTAVAWSVDGRRLASASRDGTVKLWDTATGAEVLTLHGHAPRPVSAVAWSPDGMRLASNSGDRILIYDATLGYGVERSPRLLPLLDQRLAGKDIDPRDLHLRAEAHARAGDWDKAATEARRWLSIPRAEKKTWFTTGWWLAGPYPADLKGSYPPENSLDPTRPLVGPTYPGDSAAGVVHWKTAPLDGNGFLSFAEQFRDSGPCSVYALLRIWSAEKRPAKVLLGSSGPVRLWLGGKPIHEQVADRHAAPGQDAVSATLEAGWTTLLARVLVDRPGRAVFLALDGEPADAHALDTLAPVCPMEGDSLRDDFSDRALERLSRKASRQSAQLGIAHASTQRTLTRLVRLYHGAGQPERAQALLREEEGVLRGAIAEARKQSGVTSSAAAGYQASLALNLLRQHKYVEAESQSRECLAIRTHEMSHDWRTFNARSLLGGALLGQGNFAEAEPLLVDGCDGMQRDPESNAPRVVEALERLVELYEATHKKDKADAWRRQLDAARIKYERSTRSW